MTRILVIDDDLDVLQFLEMVLSSHKDCEVSKVCSTKEALALVTHHKFDIIFLDINMPEYTGHDFLNLYSAIHPDRATPVVIISADKTEANVKRALNNGAVDFVPKPIFNKNSLIRILEKYCSFEAKNADEELDAA